MPIFFFDTDNGRISYSDEVGLDLPNAEAAREAALDALPDMAHDKLPYVDARTFGVTVRNGEQHVVYTATLSLKGEWRLPR